VKTQKATPEAWPRHYRSGDQLLDLAFLIFDVLAYNGIVLFDDHLFGHCTGVLFGDVEMPGPRGGVQADLDGGRLRHGSYPLIAGRRAALRMNLVEAAFYRWIGPSQPQRYDKQEYGGLKQKHLTT